MNFKYSSKSIIVFLADHVLERLFLLLSEISDYYALTTLITKSHHILRRNLREIVDLVWIDQSN